MGLFPSLFFCADIAHAFDLSAALRRHGVKVYPVSGKTPDAEELRFYRLFADGALDGLASCNVLVEGADFPYAMFAGMARPTKSGLLYRQMVGRVVRPFPAPQGPRDYQQQALRAILGHLIQGVTLQLLVLPTGTGKTIIATKIPKVIERWRAGSGKPSRGRGLFLVHRDNLVRQAADQFAKWTDKTVGIEAGGGRYAGDADIVVGSVQTLGRGTGEGGAALAPSEYAPRLAAMNPERFDWVVVDEAHHAIGVQYANVMRYMGVLKGEEHVDRQKLLLCITATPGRADNIGMEAICEKIVYSYDLRDAIKEGYLAKIRAVRVETEVDLSSVHTTAGDFNTGELSATVNTPERNELVAREYLKIREQFAGHLPASMDGWHKPEAIVADFVDVTGRHSLCTIPTLFGLRSQYDAKGEDILEQAEAVEQLQEENPTLDLRAARNLDMVKTAIKDVDLLRPPELAAELKKLSRYGWLKDGDGYRLGLPGGAMLSIHPDTLGQFEICRHVRGVKTRLWIAKSLAEAAAQADKEVPAADQKLLAADASWRRQPPTEKQVVQLFMKDKRVREKFGQSGTFHQYALQRYHAGDSTYSRGGISRLIDAATQAR